MGQPMAVGTLFKSTCLTGNTAKAILTMKREYASYDSDPTIGGVTVNSLEEALWVNCGT